jgi:ABC-type Mn2+/Zn2+ transport system permease subunit
MIIETLAVSSATAVAAGLVGCFAVMRRMALAGDALSHVALPGIGVALALHIHPMAGALAMLMFGALLVWAVEDTSRLATETIIGVVFSAALAFGSMMSSGEQLIEALLGRPGSVSPLEVAFVLAAAGAVIVVVLRQKNALVVMLVSPDIARTARVNVSRLNLLYLEIFAITVALGLRYLGVLLMGSLIIVPAATAKRVSNGLNQMLALSAAFAVTATVLGSLLGWWLHRETGPLIITIAATGFFLSFVWRR